MPQDSRQDQPTNHNLAEELFSQGIERHNLSAQAHEFQVVNQQLLEKRESFGNRVDKESVAWIKKEGVFDYLHISIQRNLALAKTLQRTQEITLGEAQQPAVDISYLERILHQCQSGLLTHDLRLYLETIIKNSPDNQVILNNPKISLFRSAIEIRDTRIEPLEPFLRSVFHDPEFTDNPTALGQITQNSPDLLDAISRFSEQVLKISQIDLMVELKKHSRANTKIQASDWAALEADGLRFFRQFFLTPGDFVEVSKTIGYFTFEENFLQRDPTETFRYKKAEKQLLAARKTLAEKCQKYKGKSLLPKDAFEYIRINLLQEIAFQQFGIFTSSRKSYMDAPLRISEADKKYLFHKLRGKHLNTLENRQLMADFLSVKEYQLAKEYIDSQTLARQIYNKKFKQYLLKKLEEKELEPPSHQRNRSLKSLKRNLALWSLDNPTDEEGTQKKFKNARKKEIQIKKQQLLRYSQLLNECHHQKSTEGLKNYLLEISKSILSEIYYAQKDQEEGIANLSRFPADITNELKKDFLKIRQEKVASLKWLKPEFQAVNQFLIFFK